MKKSIVILLSFFILILNSFSEQLPADYNSVHQNNDKQRESSPFLFDFGGNISSNNTLSIINSEEITFSNNERLELWVKVPFGKTKSSFFAMQGAYDFSLNTLDNEVIISNVVDLPLFKFTFKSSSDKSNTTINIGRFFLSDTTGYILYQDIDGIFTDFNFEKTDFSLFAGYTGFLNANSVSYFENPYELKTGIYTLSPGYFIASSRLAFNIFNTQFLNTEFLASIDTGKLDYHKMYATLTLNGTITQRFFYILQSSLGMNMKSDNTESLQFSNLSKLDLSFYFDALESSFTLTGLFASTDGSVLKEFKPITTMTSSVIGTSYSSMTKFGFLYTLKPTSSIFMSLSSDCLGIFDDKSNFGFAGFEWNYEAKWQILSDIFLALQVQNFIPFTENTDNLFVAGLRLGFTF